ncbi:type II restriction endonuclease [Rouxiella badensis]|uniref:type II restriction endonuclease n=1 Tax=Rouxiella badensis TaxID=1646377 RepID=UPI0013EEF203|nr:type II restriction endonuclease [Rouxiella badensis]QII39500.1 restriction endonuclease [Rouxiella badensis]
MSGLHSWLIENIENNKFLFIKRLSANDTGASGGHQVGIYVPSVIIEILFPSINHVNEKNPDAFLNTNFSSHQCSGTKARAVYYNNKFFGGTRNEKRITRWGGTPLQDTENTGAIAILAFSLVEGADSNEVDVWVCEDLDEEDIVESTLGEISPGTYFSGLANTLLGGLAPVAEVPHKKYKIPDAWRSNFPSGKDIILYAANYYAKDDADPDTQLLERRQVEYEIFLLVEEINVLEKIRLGFETVNEFIAMANSVSNRRKSRAGKSLELHLEKLFNEHGLSHFATQVVTEGNKKPDFLFPSVSAYQDSSFPDHKLRMLAVKTTCKDRWRQILNEADRIKSIHLFTLQEGVSIAQFREMQKEGVKLVVPAAIQEKFPKEIRNELISLTEFIAELKGLYMDL